MPILIKRPDGEVTLLVSGEYLSAYYFFPREVPIKCGHKLSSIPRVPGRAIHTGNAEIGMITKVYAHILDEDRKISAQKFEAEFYSNPDLRNVKAPFSLVNLIKNIRPQLANIHTIRFLIHKVKFEMIKEKKQKPQKRSVFKASFGTPDQNRTDN